MLWHAICGTRNEKVVLSSALLPRIAETIYSILWPPQVTIVPHVACMKNIDGSRSRLPARRDQRSNTTHTRSEGSDRYCVRNTSELFVYETKKEESEVSKVATATALKDADPTPRTEMLEKTSFPTSLDIQKSNNEPTL